jgi:chemotaxis protein MotB
MAKKKSHGGGGGGGGGHDGGGSLRWLLTYADMITLLMAFFIMMYSMSVLNMAKFNEVAFSIRSGFGGIKKGGSSLLKQHVGNSTITKTQATSHEKALQQLEVAVNNYVSIRDMGKDVEITRDERGVIIRISAEHLLFYRGTAEMTPRAEEVLGRITKNLKPMVNDNLVEGYTCNLHIATAQYPSNWELSAARAGRVVRFMEQHGVTGMRLTAVGFGENRPLKSNTSEANRSSNRRVEIVVLDTSYELTEKAIRKAQGDDGGRRARPHLQKVWASEDGE